MSSKKTAADALNSAGVEDRVGVTFEGVAPKAVCVAPSRRRP